MKEKNTLESIFGELRGSFDLEHPSGGHRERFMQRLGHKAARREGRRRRLWRPLSVAAAAALFLTASVFLIKPQPGMDAQVARIAPEVSQTTDYFANLVAVQIRQLEEQSSPETRPMIDDALRQLRQLEADYRQLESDLVAGGNTKLILSAMITNFQTRIDLLQDVMQRIEQIKQFKNNTDATNII